MEGSNVTLIPTDYSDNARIAAEYALENLNEVGNVFWLINVYQVRYSGAIISMDLDELLRSESEKSMELELIHLRAKFPDATIKGTCFQGALVSIITKLLDSKDISMIVMGTTGASGIKEVVLGSNAANVMQIAGVPVLLIPSATKTKKIETIVFATDLKYIKGYETIQQLHHLAKKSDSRLEILHLSGEEVLADQMVKEELRLDVIFRDVPHKFNFQNQTIPEHDILDFAHKVSADLIAVVSRYRRFFPRMIHRSVTRKLSMHTDVPVLILKES